VLTEQDSDFDGKMDRTSRADADGRQVQEADANGDGRIDTWIVAEADGTVVEKREDKDGDGQPDVTVKYQGGKPVELVQSGGGERVAARYDAEGNVAEEERDTDGDGRFDAWISFAGGKPVREARDTNRDGRPDVLTSFDAEGRPAEQELIEGDAQRPNKKLFLAADGSVTSQCLDTNGDGRFDARARVQGGQVVEALLDTNKNGIADQREVFEGGARVRLDADTNGDRKPDVIQHLSGDAVTQQDEDTNFDGKLDRVFRGQELVAGAAGAPVPAGFEALDCGDVDPTWAARR
jgi:hypothetical protein